MKSIHKGRVWAWVKQELPVWQSEGIITAEGAERLRVRYAAPDNRVRQLGLIMIAVLGASLVGAGIITLLAYNWNELGRMERTVISFLPLLVTQVLAWLSMTRWKDSTAIRESVCVGLIASIGAAISLIAQTYQIGGSFSGFLLTWFVLALPAVYLLSSGFGYLLCQIGLLVWVVDLTTVGSGGETANWYPLWMAVTLPYWFMIQRKSEHPWQSVCLKWLLAGVLPIGIMCWLGDESEPVWPVVPALLFALGTLLDQSRERGIRYRPFAFVGAIGTGVLMLILSLDGWFLSDRLDFSWPMWTFCGIAGLLWMVAWGYSIIQKRDWLIAMGSLPLALLLILILYTTLGYGHEYGGRHEWRSNILEMQSSFTLYTLVVGVWVIFSGFRHRRLAILNLGVALIGLLAICRFFDSTYGLLLKGSVFIAVGVALIAVNLFASRHFNR